MQPGVATLLRIGDAPELAAAGDLAGVAELAAHLGVAGAGVEDDGGFVLEGDDLDDFGGGLQRVEAEELGGRGGFDLRERNDFLLLRGAGAGALFFHQFFEAGGVHGHLVLASHHFGQVEWKSVCIVEFECFISRKNSEEFVSRKRQLFR